MYGVNYPDVCKESNLSITDMSMALLDHSRNDKIDFQTMTKISRDFETLVTGNDGVVETVSFRHKYPQSNMLVVARHALPRITIPMRVVGMESGDKMLLKSVLDPFPDPRKGNTFKEYFILKYNQSHIADTELLVSAKQLKPMLYAVNFIEYASRKKKRHKPDQLPQSLCCRFPIPSYAMWRSLCLLPSVFYTVKQSWHACHLIRSVVHTPSSSSSIHRRPTPSFMGNYESDSSEELVEPVKALFVDKEFGDIPILNQTLPPKICCNNKDLLEGNVVPVLQQKPIINDNCYNLIDGQTPSSFSETTDRILLSRVRTALVASSALEDRSNELLEFYGDTILKYVTTVNAFLLRPDFNENRLNFIRSHLVSNSLLHKIGTVRQLENLLFSEKFDPTDVSSYLTLDSKLNYVGESNDAHQTSSFVKDSNPNSSNNSNKNYRSNIYESSNTNISNKLISDSVEALIGAFLTASPTHTDHNQLGTSWLRCLKWFGYKLDRFSIHLEDGFKQPLLTSGTHQQSSTLSDELSWNGLRDMGLDYTFHNKLLLVEALCHGSFPRRLTDRRADSNQRLEFIGDAVLEIMITSELFRKKEFLESSCSSSSKYDQGTFTTIRSAIVCTKTLAVLATRCCLHKYLKIFDWRSIQKIDKFVNTLNALPEDLIFKKVIFSFRLKSLFVKVFFFLTKEIV